MPIREQNSNKGTFGKVLNFCGSKNYVGAAYLSAVSSLKVGAGYSALASTKDVIESVSKLLPEAVFLTREEGLKRLQDFSVILIGCGLGQDNEAMRLFRKIISKCGDVPTVIDADGLNLLSKTNIKLPENSVITPHPAEAARLLKTGTENILKDIEGSAKELSEKYKCVTVLKTHRTLICNKDLSIHINEHGNSALAKAGSGDVLAGIISGLLAQGMDMFNGAKLGVYLHSRAGEIASEELTEYSVLASEILKYIPFAIKELLIS